MKRMNKTMTMGSYTRDIYILLTLLVHRGDGYTSIELAWLKWYVGVVWKEQEDE